MMQFPDITPKTGCRTCGALDKDEGGSNVAF